MTTDEKLKLIAENQPKVYKAGQKSVGTLETVSGNPVRLDYVHTMTHEIDVKLSVNNLLKVDGREVVDFGAGKNTTQRTFTGNGIIVGVTRNNYYYPTLCTYSQVTSGVVSGTSVTGGYGVGLDVALLPNTTYVFSCAERVGVVGLAQYDLDGNWLQDSSVAPSVSFTTHANAAWGVLVFSASSNDTEFRITNPQLELGTVATTYAPYITDFSKAVASKNMLDISRITSKMTSGYGVTNNGDGSITVATGAGSSAVSSGQTLREVCPDLEAGKVYTISAVSTGTEKYVYLAGISSMWKFGQAITISDAALDGLLYFYSSGVSSTATVSNIQIEEGSTATTYMPYGEIRPVMVTRYGKNILDLNLAESMSIGNVPSIEGGDLVFPASNEQVWGCMWCNPPLVVGQTYTFSARGITKHGNSFGWRFKYADNTYNTQSNSLVATMKVEKKVALLYFYINTDGTMIFDEMIRVEQPMVEYGTVSTAYEPYVTPTQHTANADGTVSGVMSVSPTTTLVADDGVVITAEYYVADDYQYHRFWDAYQDYGNRNIYDLAFSGEGWTNKTFKPKYIIRPTKNQTYMMFARTGVEVIDESFLDTSQCTGFTMSFYMTGNLKSATIDVTSLTNFNSAFSSDWNLETVVIKNVQENCKFDGCFGGCSKLANLTITGIIGGSAVDLSASPLSKDSILSVFNALSTTATGLTVTFQKAAVNAAFTTEEWDALVATKSNWTYALA